MKIYRSREQILRDIDNAHKKIIKAKFVAQENLDAEELLMGTKELQVLRAHREAADKQFRKIKRLETVRLPKLKEKLAEWDTTPLPGIVTANGHSSSSPSPDEPIDASNDAIP